MTFIIKKSQTFTYLLFANVLENELIHFYIPSNILFAHDHRLLTDTSDPVSDKKSKEIVFRKMNEWAPYIRCGPQSNILITHTYCVSIMDLPQMNE